MCLQWWNEGETDLDKRASGVVDCLEQTGVGETDSGGTEADHVAVLVVQFSLRFHVRLAVMVAEAPDVGELGQKRARKGFERRCVVG